MRIHKRAPRRSGTGSRNSGWAVGRNVTIDFRFAAADIERIRTYAAELIGLAPDVVVAQSTPVLEEFAKLTQSVPIVLVGASDPVSAGFVPSLAKPGGNITGFSGFEYSIGGKWLELLKEAIPDMTRVGVLLFRGDPSWSRYLASVEAAAPSLGVHVTKIFLGDAIEIERDIDAFAQEPHGGLLTTNNGRALFHRNLIADLAIRNRLPAVFSQRAYAVSGGLMSYGIDNIDLLRRERLTLIASCVARGRAICRSNSRPSMNLSSTCGPHGRWEWQFRQDFRCAPTR